MAADDLLQICQQNRLKKSTILAVLQAVRSPDTTCQWEAALICSQGSEEINNSFSSSFHSVCFSYITIEGSCWLFPQKIQNHCCDESRLMQIDAKLKLVLMSFYIWKTKGLIPASTFKPAAFVHSKSLGEEPVIFFLDNNTAYFQHTCFLWPVT